MEQAETLEKLRFLSGAECKHVNFDVSTESRPFFRRNLRFSTKTMTYKAFLGGLNCKLRGLGMVLHSPKELF